MCKKSDVFCKGRRVKIFAFEGSARIEKKEVKGRGGRQCVPVR